MAGTPAEAGMLAMQSVASASMGRLRDARHKTLRAIELAKGRGFTESAGVYSAGDTLWEAAYGNCREAKQAVARTLALSRGRYALSWSTLALAICGDSLQAGKLADETVRRFPEDSFFKASWLPMAQAALLLHGGDAAAAAERLKAASPIELGTNASLWPAYLRGLAYVKQGADERARLEFQRILDNKGVLVPKDFNPAALTLYPLAYLGQARATSGSDVGTSRSAYEALLALWRDADPDLAIVHAARREYQRLPRSRSEHTSGPRTR